MLAITSFFLFTAFVGFFSWLKTRHDDQGEAASYYLAGNSLPWFVVAGSLMLTNLSTEQIIGLNGGAYLNGAVVMAWEVIAAIALVLMALYFLPRYWAGGITTIPQFLERRFDRATRRLIGTIFLVSLVVNFLPFVLYSGALGLNGLFRVAEVLGTSQANSIRLLVWAIGIVGAIYAVFGGLKAVAVSDTINGVGLLVGGMLIPFLGLAALGGGSVFDGWARILENQSARLDPVGDATSTLPVGTLLTGLMLVNIFYWCTNQAIVQRVFGARSLAEGQKGVLAAAFLKLLGPLFLVLPGIIALEMFGPDLANGDLAYPMLVGAVLPTYLVGFFGAVMFGAIMSSFNSALHSSATLFGLDIFRGMLKPDATDRQTVVAGKLFAAGLAVVAMLFAPMIAATPDGLFDLMKRINAIFNMPILAVVFMGMATRSVPARAARIALFMGIGIYLTYAYPMGGSLLGWNVHWLHFAAMNFVFLCAFMAFMGRRETLRNRPSNSAVIPTITPETVAAADTPWRWAMPASITVILLMLALYVVLHSLG
jgi:solute:Na+ symporter, SSS family